MPPSLVSLLLARPMNPSARSNPFCTKSRCDVLEAIPRLRFFQKLTAGPQPAVIHMPPSWNNANLGCDMRQQASGVENGFLLKGVRCTLVWLACLVFFRCTCEEGTRIVHMAGKLRITVRLYFLIRLVANIRFYSSSLGSITCILIVAIITTTFAASGSSSSASQPQGEIVPAPITASAMTSGSNSTFTDDNNNIRCSSGSTSTNITICPHGHHYQQQQKDVKSQKPFRLRSGTP